MANIKDYIKKYGDKSFNDLDFNEIDAVILSVISYVDLDGIVNTGKKNKITIEEAGIKYFTKFNKKTKKDLKNTVSGVQAGVEVLHEIFLCDRYKDLTLYNYIYDSNKNKQFSSMFIDLDVTHTFISFEGTDDLISGWREDTEMCYKYPVPAQEAAINYINKNINPLTNKKYIFAGHSKGGNLALVSAMESNKLIKNKIVSIYMNDSPGLKNKQIESKKYKLIESKIIRIIPNNSIIGLTLRHTENYNVVLSNKKGMQAHNVLSWQVDDTKFIRSKLSKFAKRFDKILTYWLDTYNDEERKKFIDDLFEVLERSDITSVKDYKEAKLTSLMTILKESKKLTPQTRRMAKELIDCFIEFTKEGISNKISF